MSHNYLKDSQSLSARPRGRNDANNCFVRSRVMRFLVLAIYFACAGPVVAFSVVSSGQSQGGNFNMELPAPMGKYSVGRTSFYWVDASRDEPLTKNPNDRRELMVKLWYPAESASGSPAPYIDNLDKFARVI